MVHTDWKSARRLEELTVQERMESHFGSGIGVFSQHFALLYQGGNVNKVSKEVTDGDTTKKKGRLVILHKIVETVAALRNKG